MTFIDSEPYFFSEVVYKCCPVVVYGVSFLLDDGMVISIDTYGAHKVVLEELESGEMQELSETEENELYAQLDQACRERFGMDCKQLLERAKEV